MPKTWFVKSNKDGKIFGPYSEEILQQYVQQGKINRSEYEISRDSKIWHYFSASDSPVQNSIQELGKYRIIKELGRGGMGIVFQAEDTQLQRKCALKVLLPELRGSLEAVERFQREARAVAQIQHPNIIPIYEICQTPQHFFAMAYVEGVNLQKYIFDKTIQQKLRVFRQICEAIKFAHDKNIIHRDLKPDNILVDNDGVPIVLDFGIAKRIDESTDLTKTGNIFGTPKYMSPEAARSQKTDHRSDIYSLGVILYEMLTGTVPFTGENPIELLFHLTTSEPTPPSRLNVSVAKDSDLEIVCLTALAKDPEKRISNAAFFYSEIDNIIHRRPIELKPPTSWQRFSRWRKKNPLPFAIGIAAIIILSLMTLAIFVVQKKYESSTQKAQEEITKIKKNAIKNTLESINNNLGAQRIFESYEKIKECYQYLREILHDIPSTKAKEIYRELNTNLKLNILAKFPIILEKKLPPSPYPLISSPQGKYLAKMYVKDSVNTLYVWKNDKHLSLTEENTFLKLDDVHSHKVVFSPNNKYLVYNARRDLSIVFYDLVEKQPKFLYSNSAVDNVQFSLNNDYCIFRSWTTKQKEEQCNLMNLHDYAIRSFSLEKYSSTLISSHSKWLVIQDKRKKGLLLHNIQKNKTFFYEAPIFLFNCFMCFSENENKVFVVSSTRMGMLSLEKWNSKEGIQFYTSASLVFGDELSFPPIRTAPFYFAMGKKDGSILLAKQSNNSIFQERLSSYSDVSISLLSYQPDVFLAAVKNNMVELREIYTKNIISSLREDGKIYQLELALAKQGLKIMLAKEQSYKEYTLPFTKLEIKDKNIKKIFRGFKVLSMDSNMTHTMIASGHTFIYGGNIGFIVWNNNGVKHKHILADIAQIRYNKKYKQLFLRLETGEIEVYGEENIEKRLQYIHGIDKRGITTFEFSQDQEHIYFSINNPSRLIKQNITTKKNETMLLTRYPVLKILELDKNVFVLGCQGWSPDSCEIYLVGPNNSKTLLLKNTGLEEIKALATNKSHNLFAAGDKNGKVVLWKNLRSPKIYKEIMVNSEIKALSFSFKKDYLAIISVDKIFIYDLLNLSKRYEMYHGFSKIKGVVLTDDWSKLYIPNSVGEIMIFDQDFLLNRKAFYKKIFECDSAIKRMGQQAERKTKNLLEYIKRIELELAKTE
ncbi:serine/threonine-protein kinase [Candidatus Uabimicrobium sp. HlEnr_7]|uniref:serine/threonine-protein kinase n=1 Tax=Candidatus Uabimicrobium helgolandensis TaxID=3095367 RepID=UPI0035572F9C